MHKFNVELHTQWTVTSIEAGQADAPLAEVLALLGAIETEGHIRGACAVCGMSYRHAWGLLRTFESAFGVQLLVTQRRRGTTLSPAAQRLLWTHRRIQARLTPSLESAASELQAELERLLPEQTDVLQLRASHGFAVEALLRHITDGRPGVELRYRTALEAVALLARKECDMAGFQVPQGEFQSAMLELYSPWLNPDTHAFIHLAVRNSGLFVAKGNPKNIRGLADLARTDVRFVNRQVGSSTRLWIDMILARDRIAPKDIAGFDIAEFTHAAVAAHVASGIADAGIGVETAARQFGLDFLPMVREGYYFAVEKRRLDEPLFKAFVAVLRSDPYRAYVHALPGYDGALTGRVQTYREAFGA